MGKRNREKMTGLTLQQRITQAEQQRQEKEEKQHQIRVALMRRMLGLPKVKKK